MSFQGEKQTMKEWPEKNIHGRVALNAFYY